MAHETTTKSTSARPPPLPPRQSTTSLSTTYSDAPPSYDSLLAASATAHDDGAWSMQDPRSSSTQSLLPSESLAEQDGRRKLLLIYIHGFMGDETSFRSFPAHVHRLLTVLLADTHVVHTKIYPRYRSRKNISVARDNFSKWMEPHENTNTDIILLGHSMGGLLSAEVVLMSAPAPPSRPLKHRILGTINFDVPFLGMHPGVIRSGLGSIFHSPNLEDQWSPQLAATSPTDTASMSSVSSLGPPNHADTLWRPSNADLNYNQSFANDVVLPMRKGWRNALHFVHKHSGNINEFTKATKQLVTSHMEFGGAMANYAELKTRYARIRALEEDDGKVRDSIVKNGSSPPRVRFVNYYTVSTGRVKKAVSPQRSRSPKAKAHSLSPSTAEDMARGREQGHGSSTASSRSRSPRISLEEHSDQGILSKEPDMPDSEDEDEDWQEAAESLTVGQSYHDNPPLTTSTSSTQDLPAPPPPLDLSYIQDPNTRALVTKEHERAVKAYEQAVRERESRKGPQAESQLDLQRTNDSKEISLTPTSTNQASLAPTRSSPSSSRSASPSTKPKKERTFCTLPPKTSNGTTDHTWIRVFMANVDEVGAHCGLFFVDERYERLVGDVADRVEKWVREDGDLRFVAESVD